MKAVKIANVAVSSFEDLSAVSNADLLGFYNATTGKATTKFASRDKGLKQVWTLIEPMLKAEEPAPAPASAPAAKEEPTVKKEEVTPAPKKEKAPKTERKSRGFRFKFQKRDEIKEVKAGSKREQLLNLLKQPGGATFEECMAATGWNRKDCYEGIRLLHYYVGYGLDMNEQTGKIWVVF
jgi:hypothetical protein